MTILSYTPKESPMRLDIMIGNRYNGTIKIDCIVGKVYSYSELKEYVRKKYESLRKVDFDLLPSEKPKWRN